MKLYATVTSERASKGQGGNEYIEITLKGEEERYSHALIYTKNGLILYKMKNNILEPVYMEKSENCQSMDDILKELEALPTEKGEKQKGECLVCGPRENLAKDGLVCPHQ